MSGEHGARGPGGALSHPRRSSAPGAPGAAAATRLAARADLPLTTAESPRPLPETRRQLPGIAGLRSRSARLKIIGRAGTKAEPTSMPTCAALLRG